MTLCKHCGFTIPEPAEAGIFSCDKAPSGSCEPVVESLVPDPQENLRKVAALRVAKLEVREWGAENEAQIRADFEEALKLGDRIALFWVARDHENEDATAYWSRRYCRPGARVRWLELLSVLYQKVHEWMLEK